MKKQNAELTKFVKSISLLVLKSGDDNRRIFTEGSGVTPDGKQINFIASVRMDGMGNSSFEFSLNGTSLYYNCQFTEEYKNFYGMLRKMASEQECSSYDTKKAEALKLFNSLSV